MTITPKEINEHVFNVELKANRFNNTIKPVMHERDLALSLKIEFLSYIGRFYALLHSIELK